MRYYENSLPTLNFGHDCFSPVGKHAWKNMFHAFSIRWFTLAYARVGRLAHRAAHVIWIKRWG